MILEDRTLNEEYIYPYVLKFKISINSNRQPNFFKNDVEDGLQFFNASKLEDIVYTITLFNLESDQNFRDYVNTAEPSNMTVDGISIDSDSN